MNFDKKIYDMEQSLSEMKTSIKALKDEYLSCKKFTASFLSECGKSGISKVAIQRAHKSIPKSASFVFGVNNSVFTNDQHDENPSPPRYSLIGVRVGNRPLRSFGQLRQTRQGRSKTDAQFGLGIDGPAAGIEKRAQVAFTQLDVGHDQRRQ